MPSVLITGGTGYLGSHIVRKLIDLDYYIYAVTRQASSLQRISDCLDAIQLVEITENFDWELFFITHRIDIIVHAATNYGKANPGEIWSTNVEFPRLLFAAAVKARCKYFINIDTALPAVVNDYAASKKAFRSYLYDHQESMRIINLVLEYFYGPNDADWKLVTMILKKMAQKVPSIDFTRGTQKRNFIYIDDVIRVFESLLKHLHTINTITDIPVFGPDTLTIKELTEQCKRVTGNLVTECRFGVLADRPNEYDSIIKDSFFIEHWGCQPSIRLPEGLQYSFNAIRNSL